MHEILNFLRLKSRLAACTIHKFWDTSRLRRIVVLGAALIFWFLMLAIFEEVFRFLAQFGSLSDILTDYLFAFLFLALLAMMSISNGIICYKAFYDNAETTFLMTLPARVQYVFAYKSAESVLFSVWGMVMLVVPLIIGYGVNSGVPWYFYPVSLALATTFMGLPMILGAVTALFIPIILPRRRKMTLLIASLFGVALVSLWVTSLLGQRPSNLLTESGLKQVMDRITFCQHWALPSHWVSEGILAAAGGRVHRSALLFLLLLSNVLFIGMLSVRLGKAFYLRSWARVHSGAGKLRNVAPANLLDRCLRRTLFFLPDRLRPLVLKDIRSFRRDATQWSQVLLFFGLLGLYILNLPRFGFGGLAPYWHSLVSLLNLGATCLTLSTLTSRFVFPQLSLEGRRIWIIGLLPVERSTILWGKFFFAAGGSFLISGSLIALSDLMLGLPTWVILVHMVVVASACAGLNGLAVGLGAVYPNMRSDNPSEIVSGFGGTLNLLCSIFLIILLVLLVSIPLHMHATGGLSGETLWRVLALGLALNILIGAAACILPLRAGIRAFERMDF